MSESHDGSASSSAIENSKRGAPCQEILEHYTLTDRNAATNRGLGDLSGSVERRDASALLQAFPSS
jgi:hypothetical protein